MGWRAEIGHSTGIARRALHPASGGFEEWHDSAAGDCMVPRMLPRPRLQPVHTNMHVQPYLHRANISGGALGTTEVLQVTRRGCISDMKSARRAGYPSTDGASCSVAESSTCHMLWAACDCRCKIDMFDHDVSGACLLRFQALCRSCLKLQEALLQSSTIWIRAGEHVPAGPSLGALRAPLYQAAVLPTKDTSDAVPKALDLQVPASSAQFRFRAQPCRRRDAASAGNMTRGGTQVLHTNYEGCSCP